MHNHVFLHMLAAITGKSRFERKIQDSRCRIYQRVCKNALIQPVIAGAAGHQWQGSPQKMVNGTLIAK